MCVCVCVCVCAELNDFLMRNKISDRFQSGFRASHSTEPALSNDYLRSADSGSGAVCLLLDLTAAFDHNILILIDHLMNQVVFRA